jgi:type II secretory pathway predicted ATPase ExeA
VNPYDPRRPSPPESFAGRANLVGQVEESLEAAREQRSSSAILVHGHRGSGKTSALRKIEALARASSDDAVVVEIPLRETSSDADMLRSIVDEIRGLTARQRHHSRRWKSMFTRLSGAQLSVLGTGVGVQANPPSPPSTALSAWREALDALSDSPLVAICIDDAERLSEGGVGTLKTIAEAETPVPILLAVGAGPDFLRRLATHEFSPVARAFSGSTFDMEAFALLETKEALENPLRVKGAKGRWADDAIRRIHELSHGYPYLVKCLAAATYREGKVLQAADVVAAIPKALELGSAWLEREIPLASDGDIRAFVRLARTDRSSWKTADILSLGINSMYLVRLTKLEVLRKISPGRYELRKAPVIAFYHELKRRLEDE